MQTSVNIEMLVAFVTSRMIMDKAEYYKSRLKTEKKRRVDLLATHFYLNMKELDKLFANEIEKQIKMSEKELDTYLLDIVKKCKKNEPMQILELCSIFIGGVRLQEKVDAKYLLHIANILCIDIIDFMQWYAHQSYLFIKKKREQINIIELKDRLLQLENSGCNCEESQDVDCQDECEENVPESETSSNPFENISGNLDNVQDKINTVKEGLGILSDAANFINKIKK